MKATATSGAAPHRYMLTPQRRTAFFLGRLAVPGDRCQEVSLLAAGPGPGRAGPLRSHPVAPDPGPTLAAQLDRYQPLGDVETADLRRIRDLAEGTADPWQRQLPLHVTASTLIVHPPTARVLLRWHQRQQAWLQVGGHGDPGETDPLAIARREAEEEAGPTDLVPWPDAGIRHVVIVDVPAGNSEPAHEHADVRYFTATQDPDAARPESPNAPLRWLSLAEARDATSESNLRETLSRMERLLARLPLPARMTSDGDGLGDAVRVTGVLVEVAAHPVVPVFGFVDRGPVPWFGFAVLVLGRLFLLGAGVGEADADGVVQVEAFAVPGRDDRVGGDVRVVGVPDSAVGGRQGGAGGDRGAAGLVEGEGAVAGGGDQVAAFVHQRVVPLAQADQVAEFGGAAVGPVLDVVQVDPAGSAAGEPAPAGVPFAGCAA